MSTAGTQGSGLPRTMQIQLAVLHRLLMRPSTCLTGVERMAEVLRDQAPQLLRHLLPENFGAFARIFTAALLQVQPRRLSVPLDTLSPASSSRASHLVPWIKGLDFAWWRDPSETDIVPTCGCTDSSNGGRAGGCGAGGLRAAQPGQVPGARVPLHWREGRRSPQSRGRHAHAQH